MKKIGIIIGSTRPGRKSPLIAEWFYANLSHPELNFEVIDLKDHPLPFLDEPKYLRLGSIQNRRLKLGAKRSLH